jgi:hypothetical protein
MNMPHTRYVAFSYSESITTRDNNKVTRLVTSQAYRDLWGDRFAMTKLGEGRIENNQTGFKLATSVGGVGTGERGDRRRFHAISGGQGEGSLSTQEF